MDEFRKASACAGTANCVEVAPHPIFDYVLLRDSKDPNNVLKFTGDAWRAFVEGVRAGEFDFGAGVPEQFRG
jgi:hypothetical protein